MNEFKFKNRDELVHVPATNAPGYKPGDTCAQPKNFPFKTPVAFEYFKDHVIVYSNEPINEIELIEEGGFTRP